MTLSKFVILFSFSLASLNMNAQWTRLSGPEECSPTSLIRVSNNILCGTPQGIYVSSDEGVTWSDYANFPTKYIVAMINFSDTIVILYRSGYVEVDYYDSIYSTTSFDGGATWSTPYFTSELYFAELHAYGNILMVNVSEGLYISTNYGISWTNIQVPFGQYYSNAAFFDSVYLFWTADLSFSQVFSYWGNGGSSIFHSYDSLNTIAGETVIDTVFFGYQTNTSSFYDIIRSTNLAQTWQPVKTVIQSTNFRLFAIDGLLYHNDNLNHYYVSADFGNTWNATSTPHKLDYPKTISISNGDEICVKSDGSLVHYVSSADSSYLSESGIRGSNIYTMASNDSDIYVILEQGIIAKSRDFGLTWDTLGIYAVDNMLVFGDTIFCESFYPERSYDGGQTWTVLNNGPILSLSTLIKSGNRIYASWQDTYYSDDFGDHWTQLPSTTIQSSCNWTVAGSGSLAVLGNDLYNVTYDGIVSKFDNTSNSWIEVFCFPVQSGSIFIDPLIQTIDNLLIVTYASEMFTSLNGQVWVSSALNGLPIGILGGKICPKSLLGFNGELIGTCGKYGIFHSYNEGNDWQPLTPTTPFDANCLTVFKNQLYAGSFFQGVWANSTILGIKSKNGHKNSDIVIFPNPTSDYLTINFSPTMLVSRLFITDQLGRRIFDLPITQNKEVIKVSQLPKGIYFGQLFNKNEIVGNFKFTVLQ
jgi:hypothetical protein